MPRPTRPDSPDGALMGQLAAPRESLLLTGCCPWTPFGANAAPHAPREPRRCAHGTARQSLPLTGCCPWTPFGAHAAPHAPREPRRCAHGTARESSPVPAAHGL